MMGDRLHNKALKALDDARATDHLPKQYQPRDQSGCYSLPFPKKTPKCVSATELSTCSIDRLVGPKLNEAPSYQTPYHT